jgi:hypothetical protein
MSVYLSVARDMTSIDAEALIIVAAGHACDFIADAYAPSGVCYLLPVSPLQRAWRQHGREWIEHYGQVRAQNVGYVSVSVPVQRPVLMWALVDAMMVGADDACEQVLDLLGASMDRALAD